MDAPAAEILLAVDDQPGNRIELVPEIEADRPDRRLVAEPGPDGVPEIPEVDRPRISPDVARVEEQHAAKVAAQRRAQLLAPREHAVAAERQSVLERADLVAAPSANARRAAEEEAFRERNIRRVAAAGPEVPDLQPAREHQGVAADRQVMT